MLALAAAATLLALAHLPPVRAAVARALQERAGAALGARLEIGRLDYNLLARRVTLRDVRLASGAGDPPLFEAARVALAVPLSLVGDVRQIDWIEIDVPRLHVGPLQRWLASRPASDASVSRPFFLRRLTVRNLDVVGAAEDDGLTVDLRGLSVASVPEGRGFRAEIDGEGGWLRAATYRTDIRAIEGTVAYDGARVRIDRLRVATPDHVLLAKGTIGLLSDPAYWDVAIESSADVGALLASWPALPGSGRARVTGRVTGPLDAPAVDLSATADELTLGATPLRRVVAEARWSAEDGLAVSRARAEVFGGTADVRLAVPGEPAEDGGHVTLAGVSVRDALAAAGLGLRVDAAASGTLRFRGDVTMPGQWDADGTLRVRPTRPGGVPLEGDIALALRGGRWTLRVPGASAGASHLDIDVSGTLAPGALSLGGVGLGGRATVTTADLRALSEDLRTLGIGVPPALATRIGGAISVSAALGGTLASPDVHVPLDGAAATVEGIGEVTLAGTVRLHRGRVLSLEEVTLESGSRRVALQGGFDTDGGALELDLAASGWRAGDIRSLGLDHALLPEAGSVSAHGRLSGTIAAPRFDGNVDARALAWLGQRIDTVSGRLSVGGVTGPAASRGGVVALREVTAASGDGRLSLDGEFQWPAQRVQMRASASAWPLRPIQLPGESGAPRSIDVEGELDLSLELDGPLEAPRGAGRLSVAHARYGTVRPGPLDVIFTARGDGFVRLEATAPLFGATAVASVGASSPFTYQASAQFVELDLSRLSDAGVLEPSWQGQVSGTASATVEATGTLADAGQSTLDVALARLAADVYGLPVALAAPAALRVSADEFSSEGITLRTGGSVVRAQGRLTGAPDGRFAVEVDGDVRDLLPLWARVTGRAAIGSGPIAASILARGPLDAPVLTGRLEVRDVAVQADALPSLTRFSADATVADGFLVLRSARGRLWEADVTAEGAVPLRYLGTALPARVMEANPSRGDASLRLAVKDLTLATLGRLAGTPPGEDLSGAFDLRADLSAADASLDALAGTVWVDRGTFTASDITITQADPALIEVRDGTAAFEEWRWTGAKSDVALRGRVALAASPLTYEVEARGPIDLALLAPVLPGRTAGTLRLDVRATREAGGDRLSGEVVLSGGAWIDRSLQVALADAHGTIALRGDRVVFEQVSARLNGGDVTLAGSLAWPSNGGGVQGALEITGRGVTLEYPPRVVNELDATLQVITPGPRDTPIGVTGRVLVRPGALRASLRELAQMFAPAAPVAPGTAAARRERLLSSVGVDIAIETADDLVANSNDLRAQLGASVRLTGTLARPGVLGRLDIREDGELFLAGRLYRLRGGRIEFVDATRVDPRLTLLGETTVSDYEVEMQLTGPVDRLDLRLRSNPPLSQGDLASLLTTGQTLQERRENVPEADSDAARTQLLSLVSSEYLGVLGRHLGFDTVRIESSTRDLSAIDLDPVARLSVTKGLGPYFTVIYSQSLQESDDIAWILRFRPGWREVEAKSTFESGGGETYEIRQELEFGGGYARPSRLSRPTRGEAPRVSAVTIDGVPDEEAAEVRERLRIDAGDRFDVFRWQRDRERMEQYHRDNGRLRTTVFASRRTDPAGGVALAYRVDRGPLVSMRVEGVPESGALREALRAAWAESSIDEFVDEALVEVVRESLAGDNRLQARVAVERTPQGPDRVEVVIRVNPGPRTASRAFAFTGHRAFDAETLEAVLAASGVGERAWIDPDAVVGPLQAHYAAAGFLNARVAPSAPVFDGDRATLPVAITEGRLFLVAEVQVEGARKLPREDALASFGLGEGDTFTPAAAAAGAEALREVYAKRGHVDARVRLETTVDRERSTASIAIAIEEGVGRTVAGVALSGDLATRPRLTARAIDLPAGGPLDLRAVEDAQRRLYDLGVFRSVEPRFEPVGASPEDVPAEGIQPVRVVFDVEEYARYRLRYGFQVASGTLSGRDLTKSGTRPGVTVDLRRNNLFGLGLDAGGGGFFTTDRSRLRGLLQAATFAGRPLQTTFTVTREASEGTSGLLSVVQSRLLLAAEQRWRPTRGTEVAWGYDLEYDDADLTLEFAGGDPLLLLLRARLAAATGTYTRDTRDNVVDPGRGTFHSLRLEGGTSWLGSQLRFARYLGQHFAYVPAGRVTLASGLRFGTVAIEESQEESLESILVRFRTGGGTSVRGYRQDGLTPEIIEGFPRGGDVLFVLNQEARVRLTPWVGLVGFVDAGNAFPTWEDVSWSGFKLGLGTGLRVTTPVGVVRLDVGFPRPRPARHPSAIWYFSFGQAF